MCNVNISESIKSILDNEIDVTIDDDAYLYSDECDECDECEVSDNEI